MSFTLRVNKYPSKIWNHREAATKAITRTNNAVKELYFGKKPCSADPTLDFDYFEKMLRYQNNFLNPLAKNA